MKKLIVSAAILLAAMTMKAETISKDTTAYAGRYQLDKIEKSNEYGEISVRYVCYLLDVTNSKGEPRKVNTDKATYERGEVNALVFNNQKSGARYIAKALYVASK